MDPSQDSDMEHWEAYKWWRIPA